MIYEIKQLWFRWRYRNMLKIAIPDIRVVHNQDGSSTLEYPNWEEEFAKIPESTRRKAIPEMVKFFKEQNQND